MSDKNINYLDMQLHVDNDIYYIDKLNEMMYNNTKNENIADSRNKQKGCLDWFLGLFSSCLKEDVQEKPPFVGIINIGNNCYLNAGLQILSRCYPLLMELLKSDYKKDELINLFVEAMIILIFKKENYYNPTKFLDCFCKRNNEFVVGQQNCSQDFIRTILRNINDIYEKKIRYEYYHPENQEELNAYSTYLSENNIFPESKPYSIFSGILKIHIKGKCNNCDIEINSFSFSSFIDQILYLNSFNTKCKFSDVLKTNIGQNNKASMKCPKCKEKIQLKSISKFVKLPEIFIFTLERFLVRNKVPIEPDEYINIFDLIDESCCEIKQSQCYYELFAINIRKGKDLSFGHEICQIKQKNKWYTIDDGDFYERQREFNEYSYGLFYRKIQIE
jgi:ubiquitin C-terminal hydrolase